MACNEGQFKVVELMVNNNSRLSVSILPKKLTRENRARGNRKTLKWLKMIIKSNLRTLKLKSHEEYLIYKTYLLSKGLDFQARSQSQKRRTKR